MCQSHHWQGIKMVLALPSSRNKHIHTIAKDFAHIFFISFYFFLLLLLLSVILFSRTQRVWFDSRPANWGIIWLLALPLLFFIRLFVVVCNLAVSFWTMSENFLGFSQLDECVSACVRESLASSLWRSSLSRDYFAQFYAFSSLLNFLWISSKNYRSISFARNIHTMSGWKLKTHKRAYQRCRQLGDVSNRLCNRKMYAVFSQTRSERKLFNWNKKN